MSYDEGTDSALKVHVEDSVGVPVSEKVQKVVRLTPHKRVQRRTVEQSVETVKAVAVHRRCW